MPSQSDAMPNSIEVLNLECPRPYYLGRMNTQCIHILSPLTISIRCSSSKKVQFEDILDSIISF